MTQQRCACTKKLVVRYCDNSNAKRVVKEAKLFQL